MEIGKGTEQGRIRVRMKYSPGLISVAVQGPTDLCQAAKSNRLYDNFYSLLDSCPPRDTVFILNDFSATAETGTTKLLSSGFCRIQNVNECRFLLSYTTAAQLNI